MAINAYHINNPSIPSYSTDGSIEGESHMETYVVSFHVGKLLRMLARLESIEASLLDDGRHNTAKQVRTVHKMLNGEEYVWTSDDHDER